MLFTNAQSSFQLSYTESRSFYVISLQCQISIFYHKKHHEIISYSWAMCLANVFTTQLPCRIYSHFLPHETFSSIQSFGSSQSRYCDNKWIIKIHSTSCSTFYDCRDSITFMAQTWLLTIQLDSYHKHDSWRFSYTHGTNMTVDESITLMAKTWLLAIQLHSQHKHVFWRFGYTHATNMAVDDSATLMAQTWLFTIQLHTWHKHDCWRFSYTHVTNMTLDDSVTPMVPTWLLTIQ